MMIFVGNDHLRGDHTGNMITLSPLDIEDHHKKSNRDVRQIASSSFVEVDQIGTAKGRLRLAVCDYKNSVENLQSIIQQSNPRCTNG
jgi:hypothetical protein